MTSLREWLTDLGIRYVDRVGWGARAPRYRTPMPLAPDGVVWHHTVTNGASPEVAQMQAVQAFHMDAKLWTDYAYGGGIGQSGAFYEGRMAEALVYGMLAKTGGTGDPEDRHLFCVAALGDFHTPGADVPTPELIRTFGAVAGWMEFEFGILNQFRDRDFNVTACCGDRLAAPVPFPLVVPPVVPPIPPPEILIPEGDSMLLVHRPTEPDNQGWWLQLASGVMIPATGNVQSIDDAVPRVGTSITKTFWNDLVEYDALVRGKLGFTSAVKPQPVS